MSGIFGKIGQKLQKFIDRLAKANKEALGSERLDCCTLDKGEGKHEAEKK